MSKPKSETGLYLVGNGMCLCDKHLGASAAATGRDISGQPIHPVSVADALEAATVLGTPMRCETCRYAKSA